MFVKISSFEVLLKLLVAVGLAGCGTAQKGTNPKQGCESGIEYQGRTFDFQASVKMLGASGSSEKKAVREVSDTMKIYFDEAANLCSLYDLGELTAAEYADRRSVLSMRFAALVSVNKTMPANEVTEADMPMYMETITSLKKMAPDIPTTMALAVTSKGQSLQSGAVLKSGDGFRMSVEVPQLSYLYVVLIDFEGHTSRLYPAALTGTENPVKGKVHIPAEAGTEFSLDENTGTERLLVFVQQGRSHAIETLLQEVDNGGQFPTQSLTRGVGVKKSLQDAMTTGAGQTASAFGMAAMEFVIEHQ